MAAAEVPGAALHLTDAAGRLLQTYPIKGPESVIPIAQPPGIYLLTLITARSAATQQILIQ